MAHVSQKKKENVKQILGLLEKYKIVGIVNMVNLPAKQLQNMRGQLRGKVFIFMTKKRLMKVAFDEMKKKGKDFTPLVEYFKGMPALIFTNDNPFALFKTLKKSKSKAPAKAGQEAPNEIVIPAGATPFNPGPVIGELGALGVKTQVEAGKVAVTSDTVVCKEGDEISQKLAEMLTRLNILPMEVGLDLSAIMEDGVVYTKDVLDIDEKEVYNNFIKAARWATNLAMDTAYPTAETLPVLLGKAFRDSKALATEQNILTSETVKDLLGKAEMQMKGLMNTAKIDVSKKIEEKKEEKAQPKEEKKEEAKEAPEKEQEEKKDVKEEKAEPQEEKKEESKTEEKKEDIDETVSKMVEETKKFAKGEIPSADDLVKEAESEKKSETEKKEEVPSAHDLKDKKEGNHD